MRLIQWICCPKKDIVYTGRQAVYAIRGIRFLTELSDVSGDVVDMEAYAQALVCRAKNVPLISVKYVTDIIGQNSVKHWEDKLADARKGLGEFFEKLGGV